MTTSDSARADIWTTICAQLEKSRTRVAVAHGLSTSGEAQGLECCHQMQEQLEAALADLGVAQRLVEVLQQHQR